MRTFRFLILLFAFLFITNSIYAQACCNNNVAGDTNCDGKFGLADFETWRRAFKGIGGNPTTAPTQPPGGGVVKPVGIPGTWELAFQDEFDGTSLKTANWNLGTPWNGQFCQGAQYWTPDAQNVSGGNLNILYRRRAQPVVGDCETRIYDSAFVQSKGKVTVKSGQYVEFRVKAAQGRGFINVAWILPNSWPDPACVQQYEFDVLEHLGWQPTWNNMAVHVRNASCGLDHDNVFRDFGIDFTTGFHTVGVDWYPDHIDFYTDGQKSFSTAILNGHDEPGFLILSGHLSTYGYWDGPADGSTPAEATYQVDYVRVWNRK